MSAGSVELLTPRLRIRSYRLEDAPARHARVRGDPEVMRVSPAGAAPDVETTRRGIEQLIAHEREHGFSIWALEDRATGEYVGECGLYRVEGTGPEVEVAYRLARERWGQGLASEAAGACVAHGLTTCGLARVIALTSPDHWASRRVMEKIGMRYEGEVERYGMHLVLYAVERAAARVT